MPEVLVVVLKFYVWIAFPSCVISAIFLVYLTYMNVGAVKSISRQQIVNYIGDGLKLTATTNGLAFFLFLVLLALPFTYQYTLLYTVAAVFVVLLLICSFVNNVVAASAFDNY